MIYLQLSISFLTVKENFSRSCSTKYYGQLMSLERVQINFIKFLGKRDVREMIISNLLRTQKRFARETEHKLVVSKG